MLICFSLLQKILLKILEVCTCYMRKCGKVQEENFTLHQTVNFSFSCYMNQYACFRFTFLARKNYRASSVLFESLESLLTLYILALSPQSLLFVFQLLTVQVSYEANIFKLCTNTYIM